MIGKTLSESMKKYFKKIKNFDLQFLLSKKQTAFYFLINYVLPIACILLITVYYFQKLFPANGILAYNDYVLPVTKGDLDAYLSNLTIYNINSNLGSVRTNFFSDIPTLLVIKFLTFFVNYQLATKFTQVASFALVSSVFYIVLRKINKSTILSFLLALHVVFNLWSFDRLEQGHYYLLGPFLAILALIIYLRYYSNYKHRSILIGHLLFLAVFTYYHYAIITIYFLILDFIVNLILVKEKRKWLIENIWSGIIFSIDMLVFIIPYFVSSLSTFRKLSETVSNIPELRIFSWQSMGISETFQIRLGMYSYKMISNFGILSVVLVGFIILYFFFFWKSSFEKNIEKRLKIAFVFLGLLGFGIWLNFDLYSQYIYKIPTFAVFRDMNKFVGMAFIFYVFLLSHKLKDTFANNSKFYLQKIIFAIGCVALIIYVFFPYDMFLVYNQDEIYHFSDDTTYSIVTFPSYPLTGITFNNVYYHKYLPSLVSTNNLRTMSLPYTVQKFDYLEQYNTLKSIYVDFDKLSKSDIYSQLGNDGVKYIIYYKRYDFKTNVAEYDEWMRKLDLKSKLSSDEIIFENSDLIVFKIPDQFLKSFVTTDNPSTQNLSFTRINDAEVDVSVKFKGKINLKLLTNFDQNWKLQLLDSNSKFECNNSQKISTIGNIYECKSPNQSDFNLLENIKKVFDTATPSIQNYSSEDSFNEWTLDANSLDGIPSNKFTIDENGDTVLKLKLLYVPNSYFVIGLYILLLNIIFTFIYILKRNVEKV